MTTRDRLIPAECGLPSLVGVAAVFGAVAAMTVAVAAAAIARVIGGRSL